MAITTLDKVKAVLNIKDTNSDTRIIAMIPIVEDEILAWRNKPFDTDEDGDIVYPEGAESVAIKLIGNDLVAKSGIMSEKLAAYSVVYADKDVRESILKGIKRYARVV